VTFHSGCINLWLGPGTSCDPNPCADYIGACCAIEGTCTIELVSECEYQWQGAGTACDPNPCTPAGACCINDVCVILTEVECGEAAGTYTGDGVACEPENPCAMPVEESTWGRIKNSYR